MMFLAVPNRDANFNRTENSVIPENVVFYIAPHRIHPSEDELLDIEEGIGRKLGVETQNQKVVGIPESAYVLTLPEPIEKFGVWFHSGICRTEGVKPNVKRRTERQDVNLAAIHEFLTETQSEIGCHAINGAG